jgi:L-aspartate oxidase
VYAATTNPAVSTGEGVALALRAGAVAADLEFVQFHPTVFFADGPRRGQQPLISEAVRGEGALLLDGTGARFMPAVHPLAELAPRDVVAKAIFRVMRAQGLRHVWLDARGLGEAVLYKRFPSILARCRELGVDPVSEPVPVAPAAHYASGGVCTDLAGRTSIPGLYACGEVACTGVHGANRLASNSLLEGLVYAGRIGDDLAGGLPAQADPVAGGCCGALLDPGVRMRLQDAMTGGAGLVRDAAGLAAAAGTLAELADQAGQASGKPEPDAWEVTNLHTVAAALAHAAARREETRGSHWRADFPDRDDLHWRGRLRVCLTADGTLTDTFEAM